MSELNREIAELLGCFVKPYLMQRDGLHGWRCGCTPPEPLHSDDFEHSVDASMAVIRERWPDATVTLFGEFVALQPRGFGSGGPVLSSHEGDTDAARLAHALKEALSE